MVCAAFRLEVVGVAGRKNAEAGSRAYLCLPASRPVARDKSVGYHVRCEFTWAFTNAHYDPVNTQREDHLGQTAASVDPICPSPIVPRETAFDGSQHRDMPKYWSSTAKARNCNETLIPLHILLQYISISIRR